MLSSSSFKRYTFDKFGKTALQIFTNFLKFTRNSKVFLGVYLCLSLFVKNLCDFVKNETPTQVFQCEIFQNTPKAFDDFKNKQNVYKVMLFDM